MSTLIELVGQQHSRNGQLEIVKPLDQTIFKVAKETLKNHGHLLGVNLANGTTGSIYDLEDRNREDQKQMVVKIVKFNLEDPNTIKNVVANTLDYFIKSYLNENFPNLSGEIDNAYEPIIDFENGLAYFRMEQGIPLGGKLDKEHELINLKELPLEVRINIFENTIKHYQNLIDIGFVNLDNIKNNVAVRANGEKLTGNHIDDIVILYQHRKDLALIDIDMTGPVFFIDDDEYNHLEEIRNRTARLLIDTFEINLTDNIKDAVNSALAEMAVSMASVSPVLVNPGGLKYIGINTNDNISGIDDFTKLTPAERKSVAYVAYISQMVHTFIHLFAVEDEALFYSVADAKHVAKGNTYLLQNWTSQYPKRYWNLANSFGLPKQGRVIKRQHPNEEIIRKELINLLQKQDFSNINLGVHASRLMNLIKGEEIVEG